MKIKLKLFNLNIKIILNCGFETWRLENEKSSFWAKKISRRELNVGTGKPPVNIETMARKWKWVGHLLRKTTDDRGGKD